MSRGENFPVGSVLIRSDLRPAVHAFYAWARAADDAADDPRLRPEERLRRLQSFEDGLDGRPGGAAQGAALLAALRPLGAERAVRHARALLVAFRRDAGGIRAADWKDLMEYCRHSAVPVGRFLLDLHGEGAETRGPADALCAALQILNHVQDIRHDEVRLGRCYLPGDWLAAEGVGPADLAAARATPALGRVIARTLAGAEALLAAAEPLPARLCARRLAGEAAAMLTLARGLAYALRRGDPLADRIAPSRAAFAWAGLRGLAVAALRPATSGARSAA